MPLGCPSGPVFDAVVSMSRRFWALVSDGATLRPMSSRRSFAERWPRPSVMGVLNVTPDSFSDGGLFVDPADAIVHGRRLVEEGAALVDVGGESTRPGAAPVTADEELDRVEPVLEGLSGLPVSIDTSKAIVARRALELGAELVNDVTASARRPRAGRGRCGRRRVRLSHAHAGRAANDASGSSLRRRRLGCVGLPRGADRVRRRAGRSRGADLRGSRYRLRQDARSEPRAAAAPRCAVLTGPARARRASRGRARSAGCSAMRTRRAGASPASLGAAVAAFERGAAMIRAHDVQETVDALAVAAAVERGKITA